jgi:hypothetical protein
VGAKLRELGLPDSAITERCARGSHSSRWISCPPTARLVVETDGRRHHRTRAALETTAARAGAGYRTLRFTGRQAVTTRAADRRRRAQKLGLIQSMCERSSSPVDSICVPACSARMRLKFS